MSFDYRPYPDISKQCVVCKRFDCSAAGEKWLHLTTVLTDNEYQPAIGAKCRAVMWANDPDRVVPEAPAPEVQIRPPTDEEIGAWVRNHMGVKTDDADVADNAHRAAVPDHGSSGVPVATRPTRSSGRTSNARRPRASR